MADQSFSEKELQLIAAFSNPTEPEPTSSGYGGIVARDLANLPANTVRSMADTINSLATGKLLPENEQIPRTVNPPQIDETSTTGQKITDLLLGGLAPEIAATFIPYAGVSKLAKAAGASQNVATVLANIAQGGIAGAKYGDEEMARMAATGGATTAVGALPWAARIPVAAGIAAADYGYVTAGQPERKTEGLTAAAVDLVAGLIGLPKARKPIYAGPKLDDAPAIPLPDAPSPSGLKLATEPVPIPTPESAATAGGLAPSPEMQGFQSMQLSASAGPLTRPLLTPEDIARIEAATTHGMKRELVPAEIATLQSPLNPAADPLFVRPPKLVEPGQVKPTGPIVDPFSSSESAGPIEKATRVGQPRTIEIHRQLTDPEGVAAEASVTARKGKLQSIPEYRRTEGGEAIREIVAPIVGAAAGGLIGEHEGGAMGAGLGALGGLAAGYGIAKGMPRYLSKKQGETGALFIGPKSSKFASLQDRAIPIPETEHLVVPVDGLVREGFDLRAMMSAVVHSGDTQTSLAAFLKKTDGNFNLEGTVFEHYPELFNAKISFYTGPADSTVMGKIRINDAASGNILLSLNKTQLKKKLVDGREAVERELQETLTHELQHFIQEVEGHPSGSSSKHFAGVPGLQEGDAYKLYLQTHGEMVARLAGRAEISKWIRKVMDDPDRGLPWLWQRERETLKFKDSEKAIQDPQRILEMFPPEKKMQEGNVAFSEKPPVANLQKQTDTPEFRQWFGQSKVKLPYDVNKPIGSNQRIPKKVFNGYLYEEHQHPGFIYERGKVNNVGDESIGFYFSDNRIIAEEYSTPIARGDDRKGAINEVYLRMEKPLEFHKETITGKELVEFLESKGVKIPAEVYDRWKWKFVNGLSHESHIWRWLNGAQMDRGPEWNAALRKAIQDAGYDGIIHPDHSGIIGGFDPKQIGESKSYVVFNSEQIKSATANSGKFSLKDKDIRGFASREIVLPLAGAAVGGTIGQREAGTEGMLAGAILGGTAGILGVKAIDALERVSPALKPTAREGRDVVETVQKQSTGVFDGIRRALNEPAQDLAGENVFGRGGILSKVASVLQSQFRLNLPERVKTAFTQARGFASEIVDNSQRALQSVMRMKPPQEIIQLTDKFLHGQLTDSAEEIGWLTSNGGMSKEAWEKLSKTARGDMSPWSVMTNDVGADGKKIVKTFYAPDDIRGKWLEQQEQSFIGQLPEEWKMYGEQLLQSRRGMNEFQKIVYDALPQGRLRDLIGDSIGRYVPRQYRIFTDSKYRATDEQIKTAMEEFGFNRISQELTDAVEGKKGMEESNYLARIATLQKSQAEDASIHLERLGKYQKVEHGGKSYMVAPEISSSVSKFSNEDFLKRQVESYLNEIVGNRQLAGKGSKGLDKTMFMSREDITPAFREMLGEYTDPVEKMAIGLQKMYAPAQAGRLISMAREMEIDGLPASMSDDFWHATNTKIKDAIIDAKRIGDDAKVASLQTQLARLEAYAKLPPDIKFGDFAGLNVHHSIHDYFNEDWRMWENSVGRHMADLNRFFKTTHIPLNPVTQVRQWVSMPFFALIGKATPSSINQALSAYRNLTPEIRKELLQQGIWTADFIRGELKGTVDTILNGRYDSAIMRKGRATYEGIMEAYRIPDMLIRGGTYISAKNRIAARLGKAIDDPEVIRQAVEWTDKYTMNYDNISAFVKNVRNVPLINPFISFQAEMLRILKNMVVEGTTQNPERLATLGGILAFPGMMAMAGEGSLKKEDRDQWEKTKKQLPDYMRHQSLVPIARLQNGQFKYLSLSPIIPQDNLDQTVRAMAKGDTEAIAQINPFFSSEKSPLFNAISELVTGEDKETGLVYRNNLEKVSDIVSEFLPPLAPGGYEWSRLANVNVVNLKTGRTQDWGDLALRYSTGVTSGVVSPSAVQRSGAGKLKRDISDLREYFTRVAKTTVSEEKKMREYNRYREGVKLLIQEFAERYGQ